MDGKSQNTRHRSEPVSEHEDQSKDDLRHGAAEFQKAACDPTCCRPRQIGSSSKAGEKSNYSAQNCACIGDQQSLAEQLRPFDEAPVPLDRIAQDRLAIVERKNAPEIIGKCADLVRQQKNVETDPPTAQGYRQYQHQQAHQKTDAALENSLTIAAQQRGQLTIRELLNGNGHDDKKAGRVAASGPILI